MLRTAAYLSAGMISGLLLCGCYPSASTSDAPSDGGGGHAHAHPTEGPHHGQLIELGNEEYHGELVHDDDTNAVTIYILDDAAKELVAIPETDVTLQLFVGGENKSYTLTAVTESGDVSQGASKFETVDEELVHTLHDEHELQGRLQVSIGGTQFTGKFEHAEHDEHGHDHDDGHDDHDGHDDDDGHEEDHDHDDEGHTDH